MAIERKWTMDNSDINEVGESLGFEWNAVCDEVANEELHGSDGSGYCTVTRRGYKGMNSQVLVAIFDKIFNEHPDMQDIIVLDNF